METEKKPEKIIFISAKNWILFREKLEKLFDVNNLCSDSLTPLDIESSLSRFYIHPYGRLVGSSEEGYEIDVDLSSRRGDLYLYVWSEDDDDERDKFINQEWEKTVKYWEEWKKKLEEIFNQYIPDLKLISFIQNAGKSNESIHSMIEENIRIKIKE